MPTMRPPRRGVSYSEALTAAYASNPEEEVALDTLEFIHPTFLDENGVATGIRVVCDNDPLYARLEDDAPIDGGIVVKFTPVYFKFTRPPETDSGSLPEVDIQVDNVSRILIPYLDNAKESRVPVTVIWRPYLPSDLEAPHISPVLNLTIRSINANINTVNARAGFTDLANRRFPSSEYTAKKFPGLVIR